ncbi:MAG TPA: sensor histidine kinase [Dongiaceae bacterium]|nr:sensor histidine kinase [Dongiaceae bacterium]
MSRRSLRRSLLVGALLWTLAIVGVVNVVSLALVHHFPRSLGIVHWVLLGILGVALVAAALVQVRYGLGPIRELQGRLAALKAGRERRVIGDYPTEVQPLVDDLNALLDDRERRVTRAHAKAGDFAHALKTPLAILAQEAERLRAEGHGALAATVDEQVGRMRAQVERHLAQARAAASGTATTERTSLLESVEGLARTMRRLHAGRGVAIELAVAPEQRVRVPREELDEMLGNLLDNACKWARSTIRVASQPAAGGAGFVVITIDDDGPGIPAALRDVVLQRGVRADQAAPGSGLGLAIVSDLAELFGGGIALGESSAGGLCARLTLPS